MLTINLDPLGLVDKVEGKIIDCLPQSEPVNSLLLDMSFVEFIRVEALMYLVSFITKRKVKNLNTKIKYFSNEKIRKFLHNCRFFETIKDVADIDIHDLVIDLPQYFDKTSFAVDCFRKPKYKFSTEGYSRELSEQERIEQLRDIGFYPLTSLPFGDDSEKSYTLKEEPKNWTEGKPLISIIQKNLPEKVTIEDKISKHIIYESITNAIRHPNSKKLVISCIGQENHYTLVIWDNGESIIDTLKTELQKGHSIKTDDSEDDFHSCYCILKEKKPGPPKADDFQYYFSYEVPDFAETEKGKEYKKEDWFVLLSSFFPGVTRDPMAIDYKQNQILHDEHKPSFAGRGLTYLINAAVRTFGGEVRVRTGNYFINIKKAEKDYKTLPKLFFNKFKKDYYVIDLKDKYDVEKIMPQNKKIINSLFRAKFQKLPNYAAFHGNMITIHIPRR